MRNKVTSLQNHSLSTTPPAASRLAFLQTSPLIQSILNIISDHLPEAQVRLHSFQAQNVYWPRSLSHRVQGPLDKEPVSWVSPPSVHLVLPLFPGPGQPATPEHTCFALTASWLTWSLRSKHIAPRSARHSVLLIHKGRSFINIFISPGNQHRTFDFINVLCYQTDSQRWHES